MKNLIISFIKFVIPVILVCVSVVMISYSVKENNISEICFSSFFLFVNILVSIVSYVGYKSEYYLYLLKGNGGEDK